MHSSPRLFALATVAILSSTTSASPLQPSATHISSSPLQSNAVNCSNVLTGLAPPCWFNLSMTTYLNNWVATSPYTNEEAPEGTQGSTNSSTTTNTQPSGNPFSDDVTTGTNSSSYFRKRIINRSPAPASGQCEGGKPFSTCFLQLQEQYAFIKFNCSKINTGGANGTCPEPKPTYYSNDPQTFYAMWNFYALNTYVSTFHLALTHLAHHTPTVLSTAATQAAPGLPYFHSAAQTLSIDVPLLNLLIASTGGHELPGGQNTPLLALLEAHPSRVTYGEATPATELTTLMQARLEGVLGVVGGDERAFVGVVGNGAFSTREVGSVEGLVGVLGG